MNWSSPNFNDYETFALESANNVLLDNKFDKLRHTVLYFHGFLEKLEDENLHLIVDSYLTRNDHNVLLVDWSKLAAGNYVTDAIPNALRVILLNQNRRRNMLLWIIFSLVMQ